MTMRNSSRQELHRRKEPEKQTGAAKKERGEAWGHCVTEARGGRGDEICPMPKGGQWDRGETSFEIPSNKGVAGNLKTSVEI